MYMIVNDVQMSIPSLSHLSCKATPNETIVSCPDFCDFKCGQAVYYH